MPCLQIGETLPSSLMDCEVLLYEGGKSALKEFVSQSPTAILFIRHFGCLGCSVHMHDLAPRIDELHQMGLKLILVGNGKVNYIEEFMFRFKLPREKVLVVTDPTLAIYKEAGLIRSIWGILSWRAIREQIQALLKGHRQNGIKGDNFQQGGALLLDRKQKIVFYHRNHTVGDFFPTNQLIAMIYSSLIHTSRSVGPTSP